MTARQQILEPDHPRRDDTMRQPLCRLILSAWALATTACLPVVGAPADDFKERTIRFASVQTLDSHW
jgi:hypothetical protein